ncbi:MAG: hypothetical protein ABI868_09950 [Acidobacteriota bacterium]
MAVPWLRILDTVVGVGDLALSNRARKSPGPETNRRAPGPDIDRTPSAADINPPLGGGGALGLLETHLTGVVVAALKEAFDRDRSRLDLEREQIDAERVRAERALRLEVLRQAGDRELTRLRLIAVMAAVSWIGTLFFAARLIAGGAGARAALGAGWVGLLAALALSFAGQAGVSTALGRLDLDHDHAMPATLAGRLAPWFVVAGLGLVGVAVLMAGTP